jgi:hypothetical protein
LIIVIGHLRCTRGPKPDGNISGGNDGLPNSK